MDGYATAKAPGPGHYDNHAKDHPHHRYAPKYGFGTDKRDGKDMAGRMSIPGPGQYGHKPYIGREGHSKSMAALATYEPHVKE